MLQNDEKECKRTLNIGYTVVQLEVNENTIPKKTLSAKNVPQTSNPNNKKEENSERKCDALCIF